MAKFLDLFAKLLAAIEAQIRPGIDRSHVTWKVERAQKASPGTITLVPTQGSPATIARANAVLLHRGAGILEREAVFPFGWNAFAVGYQKEIVIMQLNGELDGYSLAKRGRRPIRPTSATVDNADALCATTSVASYTAWTSVQGVFDRMNVHQPKRELSVDCDGDTVVCTFDNFNTDDIAKFIDHYVEISGEGDFRSGKVIPDKIRMTKMPRVLNRPIPLPLRRAKRDVAFDADDLLERVRNGTY